MNPTIRDIAKTIELWAPPALAESYDNVGLLVGDPKAEAKGILINLDVTEEMIDEAVAKGCNMIVTHHPIWFGGRKRLIGEDYVSRIIMEAIKKDVALYAVHTNLDNVRHGVNEEIASRLGLQSRSILSPKRDQLLKLTTYVPAESTPQVLEALWAAGAGQIGNYDQASFRHLGTGTFRPLEGANPAIGAVGAHEEVEEHRVEVVLEAWKQGAVVAALKKAHPYEEVAYQVTSTLNTHEQVGSGMIGALPEPLTKTQFLTLVRDTFGCGGIRYADAALEKIQKVAVCGGAGSFLTSAAMRAGAHALVTGDITYHKFFDSENQMLLLDIGHYESEQFTSELIYRYLLGKFPTFAVRLSETRSNPVKYFS